MTKIFAFSGNSNTGKTTAINYLYKKYSAQTPSLKIKIFHETAREYITKHGGGKVDNVHAFQKFIVQQEITRLKQLKTIKKTQSYDYVFIDRTALDPIIYSYRNMINNSLDRIDFVQPFLKPLTESKDLYDNVVFFTTPIKKDSRFPIYNNDYINTIFEQSIGYFYSEKVITYTNNIFFQENIESTIFGGLFNL